MKRRTLGHRAARKLSIVPAAFGEWSRSHHKIGLSEMNPLAPAARSAPSDTDPAVEAILIEGYRRMSPAQKIERVRALTQAVQKLALADIRRRHPHADEREQAIRLASRWIEPCAHDPRVWVGCSRDRLLMLSEPLLVIARLVRAFDNLAIRYVVGGSFASSLYGIPRATQDVDLVAEIELSHVDALASALAGEFYIDAGMISDAIRRQASFNVIHLATMFKADVFVARDDPWSREEFSRARTEELDTPEGKVAIRFASAEDTLLHKLVWFKLGNQVSERQWGDALGVLKVQAAALDRVYLEIWARRLDVLDLLARALEEQPPRGAPS